MTVHALADFIERHPKLFLLTGAGCSTESGIPDYRDDNGAWKRKPPVTLQAFMGDAHARRRYWARSYIGWSMMARAQPNEAHHALAELERSGRVHLLVTQNVDGLHQRAGSRNVVDLHGRVDGVVCMACGDRSTRAALQRELAVRNPEWTQLTARVAPDGDADLEHVDFAAFDVPGCAACGGVLKPDVVFFGERVPPDRVAKAMQALHTADAMLVVGSSLMVYSGFRFARAAAQAGKPVAAVNLGRTRADDFLALKVASACGTALSGLAGCLRLPNHQVAGSMR